MSPPGRHPSREVGIGARHVRRDDSASPRAAHWTHRSKNVDGIDRRYERPRQIGRVVRTRPERPDVSAEVASAVETHGRDAVRPGVPNSSATVLRSQCHSRRFAIVTGRDHHNGQFPPSSTPQPPPSLTSVVRPPAPTGAGPRPPTAATRRVPRQRTHRRVSNGANRSRYRRSMDNNVRTDGPVAAG